MCRVICLIILFFFKQKTAYEMRISDWSSDVCFPILKPKANPQADEPPPDRKATERKLNAALKRLENLNLDDYTEEQQTDIRESGVRLRALAQEASVVLKPTITSRRSSEERRVGKEGVRTCRSRLSPEL